MTSTRECTTSARLSPPAAAGRLQADDVARLQGEGGLAGQFDRLAVAQQGIAAGRARLAAGQAIRPAPPPLAGDRRRGRR